MLNWRAVVSALEQPVAKLEKPSRSGIRLMVTVGSALVLVYIFVLVLDYQGLVEAWQLNNWHSYWSNPGAVTVAVMITQLLGLRGSLTKSLQDRASILSARQAAIAGDDSLAPPVTPPDAPVSGELQLSPDLMLRLRRPDDSRQLTYLVLGIIIVVFGGLLCAEQRRHRPHLVRRGAHLSLY